MSLGQTCWWNTVNKWTTLPHVLDRTHGVSVWADRLAFSGLGRFRGLWFCFTLCQFCLIDCLQLCCCSLNAGHLFRKLSTPYRVRKSGDHRQGFADFPDQAHCCTQLGGNWYPEILSTSPANFVATGSGTLWVKSVAIAHTLLTGPATSGMCFQRQMATLVQHSKSVSKLTPAVTSNPKPFGVVSYAASPSH